ncbi:SigE family RNA polymerase sigma factor [Rugosimonospora acidiphila]|uniref:SigE family RNA polymerase sigma factor n=1 Tax=Rugosimonospora acidiphila TaxID=556531 RepID=A0ABP9RMB1_9ACTN
MQARAKQEYVDYVTARLPSLRKLAFLLCGDEHRADDLVQQTITKLYVRWQRTSAMEHLDQYVRTMLVRTFVDEKRRPWSRVGLVAEVPDAPMPGDDRVENWMVLRKALARTPRRQQAVLVLRFLYDQSVEDVARALNCSEGTVKSQTSRGLATLRRMLDGNELIAAQRRR